MYSVTNININRSLITSHILRQKCIESILDGWPGRSYQKFCDKCDYAVWRHIACKLRHWLLRFSLFTEFNFFLGHFSQQEWLCFTTKEFQNSSILENFNEDFWVEFPFNGYKPDLDSDVSSMLCIDRMFVPLHTQYPTKCKRARKSTQWLCTGVTRGHFKNSHQRFSDAPLNNENYSSFASDCVQNHKKWTLTQSCPNKFYEFETRTRPKILY